MSAQAGVSEAIDQVAIEQTITDLVTSYVGEAAARDVPLAQQGLDSLAAMELRQKLQVSLSHNACPFLSITCKLSIEPVESLGSAEEAHHLEAPQHCLY